MLKSFLLTLKKIRNAALRFALAYWLWGATLCIALTAVTIFNYYKLDELSHIGSYVSGFAAALAFMWLVAGSRMQSEEIRLQREELRLQRIALEHQAKEMKETAKFAGYDQIQRILKEALDEICESEISAQSPSELYRCWTEGMKHWKPILESTNPQEVVEASEQWLPTAVVVKNYIASIAQALRIYLESQPSIKFEQQESDARFVYVYSSWMRKVPYLSKHEGTASFLANFVFLTEPAEKAITTAILYAGKIQHGEKYFHMEKLQQNIKELEDKGYPVPAIVKIDQR